jgi:hypothetical protein
MTKPHYHFVRWGGDTARRAKRGRVGHDIDWIDAIQVVLRGTRGWAQNFWPLGRGSRDAGRSGCV